MNKNIIIIIIVLVLVFVGILWFFPITPKLSPQTAAIPSQSEQVEDSTAAITKELDSININDSSSDFMEVNKDIESL